MFERSKAFPWPRTFSQNALGPDGLLLLIATMKEQPGLRGLGAIKCVAGREGSLCDAVQELPRDQANFIGLDRVQHECQYTE
jgi:hypothetical protein